ncbi:MAG: aminotransferase class V-fold PLP-dependent enzyme [Planctomycetota bacterium]|jgi:cysteine desulfurase family protein
MIYLDHSATSFPKPEEVYTFMDGFYRSHGVNPGRSGFDLSLEAGHLVDETRKLLTGLFNGGDPDRLCFSSNATDALNLVFSGLLETGDHVITTELEHNSVLRPLHHLQTSHGVEVDHVPFDAAGFVDPNEIRRRFKTNTRLVVVTHASNAIGTIQPIGDIGLHCREADIPFVVDASQSAGVLPIDVEAQHIDIVVFTGHKSLMGPTGIGGLYVREGIEIAFSRAGGTGVRSAVKTHLAEYPYRLEYGTLNLLGVAGLNAGVKWVLSQGLEAIHEREMALCALLRDGVREVEGVTTYCQDDLTNHIAVFLFNIEGFEADATSPLFDVDHDVACRTGLHCAPRVHERLGTMARDGAIRFSLGPFNTADHVRSAIAAVADIASMRRQ